MSDDEFQAFIKSFPVRELERIIGAPSRTIYGWRNQERMPPDWLKPILLSWVNARLKPAKKG